MIYAALSFYQINLPGLHYDEAFEAVPALQLLRDQPVTAFRNSGLTVGDQIFPFMTQDYIGAINTYGAIPFILLFGPSPTALRTMSILVGGVTLWLTYALGSHLTGYRWVGLAAILLLAVDPTFVFWNRQGIFVTAVTATIGLATTLCWLRHRQTGRRGWAIAGAFLLGLGLYAKFLFLWLIIALTGAMILLNLPHLKKLPGQLTKLWKVYKFEWLLWTLAFLLGAAPLLAYNLQTAGTFLSVAENTQTSFYGVNNLAFGPNLLERLKQFITFTNGSHLWYLGDVVNNPLPALCLGLVLGLVIIIYITTRNYWGDILKNQPASLGQSPPQIALFPFLVIGLTILASIGTVSALWITHFAILMPWPAIALTVGGWLIYITAKENILGLERWARQINLVMGLALGLLVATNLVSAIRYHRALAESGGLSTHSDAVYDLSRWLANYAQGPVVAMDWGLAAPVTYLTGGKVTPTEIFGYAWQSDVELDERLDYFISEPDTLYLWRSPDEIIFDRSPEFKTLYRPLHLEENIEAAFYERSGRPILGVTRLVQTGTAENPP